MKRITIRLTGQELARLDAIATYDGRSRSTVVRDAIGNYLAADSKPRPASIGIIKNDDGTLTSENLDDWLRANWRPD